jgi:hypothetical protein
MCIDKGVPLQARPSTDALKDKLYKIREKVARQQAAEGNDDINIEYKGVRLPQSDVCKSLASNSSASSGFAVAKVVEDKEIKEAVDILGYKEKEDLGFMELFAGRGGLTSEVYKLGAYAHPAADARRG